MSVQCEIFEGQLGPINLAGPFVFGVALDLGLFGISTTQIYIYYLSFPKDRRFLKLVVSLVYLIGVAQTVFALVDLYTHANTLYCPGVLIEHFPASHYWFSLIGSSAVVALIVQCIYAHRVYIICRKWWISILITCLSLGQFASGLIGTACINIRDPLAAPQSLQNACTFGFAPIWGPLSAACDITIFVSMSFFLLRRRRDTQRRSTHSRLTQVVQVVVETGMTTGIAAICYTVLLKFVGVTYLIPGLAMNKIYGNTMFALLNSRVVIIGGRNSNSNRLNWETIEITTNEPRPN